MTQLSPAISVILPIYNMAQYLSIAINSVTGQSLKNIEIICVDDCSTDASPKILSEAATKDDRIKIMTMPDNSGAGPARNAGIKAAKGDYIAFLDPDDILASEDVLGKLYNAAIINKVDVVGGNLQEFYDDSADNAKDWGKGTFVKDGITDYSDYPYAVGYTRFIYKRDMIIKNDFFFPPLRRYQDPVWFASIMTHVKKFYGMNMPVYLYRQTYDIIAMTPDKLNHVLTGVAQNLNLFRINKMPVHYKREQKELDYCLYRGFYYAIKNPFSDIPKLWNIYKNHAEQSPDLRLQLYHGYGVLRYGLTLLKKKLMHSRTKNNQTNETHFIAITKSSGGTKNTSTAIASAWAIAGRDVCLTSFLPGKIDYINGVKTHAIMESDFKNPSEFSKLKTVFLCFFSMLKWFVTVNPKKILVIGLPLSVPLMIISKLMWWRDCDIMILIDTHITANLK